MAGYRYITQLQLWDCEKEWDHKIKCVAFTSTKPLQTEAENIVIQAWQDKGVTYGIAKSDAKLRLRKWKALLSPDATLFKIHVAELRKFEIVSASDTPACSSAATKVVDATKKALKVLAKTTSTQPKTFTAECYHGYLSYLRILKHK